MKNKKLIDFFILCCILSLFFIDTNGKAQSILPGSSSSKLFRASASTSNIIPPLGKGIVGNFGTPPPAEHVHDELHGHSLILDDGITQLVFVVVDNVAIKREVFEEAKRLIYERTGLPKEHILMSAIHTHSWIGAGGGPEGYELGWCSWNVEKPLVGSQNFLVSRMVDGVERALNNLETTCISWEVGKVPQHVFNRRWKMNEPITNPFGEKDQVRMNPGVGNSALVEPAGPTDPEVSLISVKSTDGWTIALLGNYSLNYMGGVPRRHLSADYFGYFADRVQELLGADLQDPPFVGMMSNGTSGDVNNINFRSPVENHPHEKMRVVANDVAQEVIRVQNTINHHDWVPLQTLQSELELEIHPASSEYFDPC
jgi:neutral ceramidase